MRSTFVGPLDEFNRARQHLTNRASHVLIQGGPGTGKSHWAELLLRQVSSDIIRVLAPCYSLSNLAEFLHALIVRSTGIAYDESEPTPAIDISVARLEAQYQRDEQRLLVLIEELPAFLERTLRASADVRRLASLLQGGLLTLVATSTDTRLSPKARPLDELFHVVELSALTDERADELIRRQAADPTHDTRARTVHSLRPIVGHVPRVLIALYAFTSQHRADDLRGPMLALLEHMDPCYQMHLNGLSPQQGLVLARLALAPGPMPASQLGRQCALPTSHTTAILDVLLRRQLVTRVPGPGKRNLYALADRLLRLWLNLRERDHQGVHFDTLLEFYTQVHSSRARRAAFEDLRQPFAALLREHLAPTLGDILAALRTLVHLLGLVDRDQGNRVLAAFLDQPPEGHDLEQLEHALTGAQSGGASSPGLAVSHVAHAAHLIRAHRLPDAGTALTHALTLGPNWRDLELTLALVYLAVGTVPRGLHLHHIDHIDHLEARDTPWIIVRAAARCFASTAATDTTREPMIDPAAVQELSRALQQSADHMGLWTAIAAILPRHQDPRALHFFDIVREHGLASADFLGVATAHAFECGLWSHALIYIEERHALEPLPQELLPVWAWVAAQSGQLASYATATTQLLAAPSHQDLDWLWPALLVALRASDAPLESASVLAPLFADRTLERADIADLFGALLWVHQDVSAAWIADAIDLLARLTNTLPEPFRRFREFVVSGQDERALRSMHPEMRAAIELIGARAIAPA